jgi:hypothetical protein
MQSGDAPSSAWSERFVGNGRLRLTGLLDGKTLAVPGTSGFVGLAHRAVIKQIR